MENLYNRDLLSYNIDKKIKYLCSDEEKDALMKLLNHLTQLVKDKNLLEQDIKLIKSEIDKILLYNI